MEQFNLDTWLQDKSRKVVTRRGNPVRIVCWDRNTTYWKIVGLVTSPDGSTENPFTYDVNGNESDGCLHDHGNDLFFADEEEKLTEFEKCVQNILNEPHFQDIEAIKQFSKTLLELARKELMKDFPMWKKCDDNLPYPHIGGLNERYLINKGYCIKISELEKLPKEE